MPEQPSKHGEQHGPRGPDPIDMPVVLFGKVSGDRATDPALLTGDGQLFYPITRDMDLMWLTDCEAKVSTTSSSGAPTVQLRLTRAGSTIHDMLSTKLSIDAGDYSSRHAATPKVINAGNSQVEWGDQIAVDVDVAGTGTKGLSVTLTFERGIDPTRI